MRKLAGGRGLVEFCRFTDSYGAVVRVQTSSSAKGPRVWIFIRGGKTGTPGNPNDGGAYLAPAHARWLRGALDRWLASCA